MAGFYLAPAAGYRPKPPPLIRKRKYYVLSFASIATPNGDLVKTKVFTVAGRTQAQGMKNVRPKGLTIFMAPAAGFEPATN